MENNFQKAAEEHRQKNFLSELWHFLRHRKAWWLVPIVVALLLFSALIVLSSTGVAPFIYTLF